MSPSLDELVLFLFGGDAPEQPALGQIAARSALLFMIAIAVVRIGKSRLMSRASTVDVILGFVLGSLLARGISGSMSLSATIVAMATLVVLHGILTAVAFRSHWIGNLVKGHCHCLVSNGEIDANSLRQSHISENDLLEALRLRANTDDLSRVKAAYKERNGEVSFVLQESDR
jgi:uncharacterized membrane protein YcaP (DUF421 family)